ncbi:MAG: ribose 5-phosphate isomerase B [Alphaproteobacteria bacterium]|nr:ribose 5-phosphate isomerase B [Alphaproteobacteria bacterium]
MSGPTPGRPHRRLRVALAADHAGYELKELVGTAIAELGHQVIDLGCDSAEQSVDYPDFGYALARTMAAGKADRGIIVCGTGIGISMAANREPAVRAALCHSGTAARLARQHNDANVLAFGARIIGTETALDCVTIFLQTEFEGGRHRRRVAKLGERQIAQAE